MALKLKKRRAETLGEDLSDELGSPPNRTRIAEFVDDVKVEETIQEKGDLEDGTQEEDEEGEPDIQPNEDLGVGDDHDETEEMLDEADDLDNTPMEHEKGEEEDKTPPIRKKVNVEGRPAEAGIIKTIVVENFMCHRKLKVDFCRNINFIHGQNGSGKSAILAAIQICLGANARRTHRARNIKDLVRKNVAGRNPNTCAKVSVTILNGGEDGYKPDLYGGTITVVRTINLRAGFSGYRLLDADGKEVSRKKCDLDDMLDFLNIQVDNPVAILDQEEAKKFLTGKASDKYDFFMKATELQRIDRVFACIIDRSEVLEGQKSRLADSLARKSELVRTLKKKVDEFQAVEKLEKQRLDLEVSYSWAFYNERNSEYEDAFQKMETFKKKVKARQLELTQAEEAVSGSNDEDEEKLIREQMEELQKEARSQAKLKRDMEAEAKLAQNPLKQAERKIRNLEAEKKEGTQNLNRAKRRLKEARELILSKDGTAESDGARRTALLHKTEEALTQAKKEKSTVFEEVAVAYRNYEEQEPEYEQTKQAVAAKNKQLYAVKSKLRQLSSSETNDPAAIFGQKCSQMVKLVEQAKQKRLFKGEVIGPIGAFLTIKSGKEKYAEIAEMALGHGTLDRFIVTNDHDRKQFQKLREQLKCFRECGMFQIKVGPRFEVPAPPAPEIETVASILVVSHDIVFNCLVDNARIDQRALASSKEISEQHLLVNENCRYRIKGNIIEATFLPRGDKWTVRDGAISLSSNVKKGGGRHIGVDRTQAIKEAEVELCQLEDEVKRLTAAEKEMSKIRHELQRIWNDKNKAKRAHEDTINQLTRKKEEIENDIETTANITVETTDMEEDVASAEEALLKIGEEEACVMKEIENLNPALEHAKKRLEEVQIRNEKVLKDMKDAEESLEACLQRQTLSQVEIEKKRAKVKKYNGIIQEHQCQVDKTATERENALQGARKLTLRRQHKEAHLDEDGGPSSQTLTQDFTEGELDQVEIQSVPKDSDTYQAKLKRIKDKIVKEKQRRDLSNQDPTDANERWLRAKKDLQDTQKGYREAELLLEQTMKDLHERKKRWSKLRKHLEVMTDSRFDTILRLNQSCGELEFDDEKGELNLVVQKNINDPDSQTKDVKALSGGERSYTTIALLLALGESLETPFRVLDEFDVFLDPQARKLVIQTMIHVAKQMDHRQFIFITPQDLSSVKPDDKVKVFHLRPPSATNAQVPQHSKLWTSAKAKQSAKMVTVRPFRSYSFLPFNYYFSASCQVASRHLKSGAMPKGFPWLRRCRSLNVMD